MVVRGSQDDCKKNIFHYFASATSFRFILPKFMFTFDPTDVCNNWTTQYPSKFGSNKNKMSLTDMATN
jgi:hypothetical protein